MLVVGSVAVQIIISLLHTVCAVYTLTGSGAESGIAEAVGCSCVHSLAFTVLLVIFVRCWQRLAAKCEALLTDEQPEDQSVTTD